METYYDYLRGIFMLLGLIVCVFLILLKLRALIKEKKYSYIGFLFLFFILLSIQVYKIF